jgi:hypothetical protein
MATILKLDDEQSYEAELSQCVGVTGYHHWFFLNALADAIGCDFAAYAVESRGERLGVVPVLVRRRGPVSLVNFVPVGAVGPAVRGEALRAGRAGELLHGARSVLRRHRTVAARWAFAPGLSVNPADLAKAGFAVSGWENYVIPGTVSVDDLLKGMTRSRRQSMKRHLRRGAAAGITIAESTPGEVASQLPSQIGEVYARQGRAPLYSQAEASSLTSRLASHPRMLWRTVRSPDGAALGMAGCIVGDDRLWGWLITGTQTDRVSIQVLVYWDLIKWSLERGLALDLGGAPNDGIRELKTSLGAEEEIAVRALQFRPAAAYRTAARLREWGPVRDNWVKMRRAIGD